MNGIGLRAGTVAAVLALFAAACGEGTDEDRPATPTKAPAVEGTPTGESGAVGPFSVEDLERIVLKPAEAPAGTEFYSSFPGGTSLNHVFAGQAGGVEGSFVDGVENEFSGDGGPLVANTIDSGALLFDDGASAAKAFRLLAADYGSREQVRGGIEPVRGIPAESLGEESFGVRGSFNPTYPPYDFVLYAWREGNLVLYVYGWGPRGEPGTADQERILDVARTMDRRTAEATDSGLEPFTSARYGYSIAYPAGWLLREAARPLYESEFPYDFGTAVDRFYENPDELEPEILVAAQDVPRGTTLDQWTAAVVKDIAETLGCKEPDARESIRVGGEPATLLTYDVCSSAHHQWVPVLHGTSAFHIIWLNDPGTQAADRPVFEQVLATFAFTG